MAEWAPDAGQQFTKTIHKKAEGPTDPEKVHLPDDFTVVVTGAGKGLGWHISVAFAKAGATNIIIASRTRDDLERLEKKLQEVNPKVNVLGRPCDTMKMADLERLASETKQNFDRVDVVVANAGIISKYLADDDGSNPQMPVGIVNDTDFEHVIDTNLLGTWRTAKNFVPLLAGTHQSPQAFVAITSVATHCVDSSVAPTAYNVSKLAISRMVEHIHNDHFEKEGVQAFAVHPGAVLTPQTEKHSTTQRGEWWDDALGDDIGLCGGFLTWLSSERREWLSGRYLAATWDTEELESMKDEIVKGDKLKMRMTI
ncbi:hypothetical protein R6Q59_009980 [Mikania micrantha]